ncbi:MAG: hypothetical protein ACJ8HI_13660 [Massilia sp.]
MNPTTLTLLVLTPILVWRVYRRLQTALARQRSIVSRHWTGILVFSAMILVPASVLILQPAKLAWLLIGAAAGIGYGVWAFRKTRLEETDIGYFFTAPPRLGMLIAMLFTARILYIGFDIFANQGAPTPPFTDSPVSMLAVGLTAGYFGTISAGLALWRYRIRKAIGKMAE